MKKLSMIVFCTLLSSIYATAQSYFDGKFSVLRQYENGYSYTLYDFSREGTVMKAKYFAQNAYQQYLDWRGSKNILLITAGAFSDAWTPGAKPVGLCVDNGKIVTRTPDAVMDGMVVVYNGGDQQGGIAVVDLDINPVTCDGTASYYPRSNDTDKTTFLNWGERNGLTLFQTQLVYSKDKSANFSNLFNGKDRERRFLAICKKNGITHHVVVDAPAELKLNLSAKNAKAILERNGFEVWYILNLDTGDKNLLYVFNGSYLRNMEPSNKEDAKIEKATNLLIYYKD